MTILSKKVTLLSLITTILCAYLILLAYVWKTQRNLTYFPASLGPETPLQYGVEYSDITINTPDGFSINGWWLEHPKDNVERPTLLYCHGNGANLSLLSEVASLFYKMGWDVLLFDYRAYGNSSGTFSDLSEEGLALDARAAYDWLIEKGRSPNKIVVWGHSLGSAVAARLANERNPKCLVLEGTFPSLFRMARYHYPWILLPKQLMADKFNTSEWLSSYRGHTLFIHAANDTVVPLFMGQATYNEAPSPQKFIAVPNIGHSDLPSVWENYRDELSNFVNGCLASE